MAVPIGQWAFNAGEVRPALFGHADLVRLHSACATLRNAWPYYSGGAFSRAGTAFVGYSNQIGRAYPPRLIPFQFSIGQGRVLEFGNFYMRVIVDGAFVSDSSLSLSAATRANPLVVTVPATGGNSATPINTSVYSSYKKGEIITLAGGSYSVPAQVLVSNTLVISLVPSLGFGTGYAPADTITLLGGTAGTKAIVAIGTTRVNSATIQTAGTGGTTGSATVTGTTGTGTPFSALVTISGGAIVGISRISVPGSYTVNPTVVTAEPVTGAGLVGAKLALSMGPNTVSITNAGVYSVNPAGGVFTQFSTSGAGTGAQFQNALMGVQSATISSAGSYAVNPTNPVLQLRSSGAGLGVQLTMAFSGQSAFAAGDWLFFGGVGGMTELNGRTLVVTAALGANQYSMQDVFGQPVNSTAFGTYTAGGTASRIYTVSSPYAEADLPWIKYAESADVMSLTCVNQAAKTEYPPYDLSRFADNDWQFNAVSMAPTIAAPGACWLEATLNWAVLIWESSPNSNIPSCATYQYAVTAVNPKDGTESVASPIGQLLNAVDIGVTAGSITVNWPSVPGAVQYNVYKATPASAANLWSPPPQVGALLGFAGSALGTQFTDNNIVPDFAQTPPIHQNPFSRGQITGVNATAGGSGYSAANATITTSTGSGASITAIVIGNSVVGYMINDTGQDYAPTDTVTITGDGSGATATLTFGAFSGTYPGTVTYFQERRGYANTLNNPDTYWFSQPGSFKNFDTRIPTLDSDAIEGSPWGQQVNGIQWFVVMPGGTVAMTGQGAWYVGGQGSSGLSPQPFTPAGQQALPESFNGVSATVPPIRIDNEVIFAQAKGCRYRAMQLQYFTNILLSLDISLTADHLFLGQQVAQHAWCEEPYKLLWVVREDGALLSMTYYKPQDVLGWARHDTAGRFRSVASVIEAPVDALYVAVDRGVGGNVYMIERMDNRIWDAGVEKTWCVDCGLSAAQPKPAATLTVSSPGGLGSLTGVTGLVGGSGYSSSTVVTVVDDNGKGPGAGATPALTIAGGVITGIGFSPAGSGYTAPALVVYDPSGQGAGASAAVALQNTATFAASAGVFAPGDVGKVIRCGGGIATITAYTSATQVTGNLTQPLAAGFTADTAAPVGRYAAGEWTMTTPTTVVGGLFHLVGSTVTGLADGNPIPPTVVAADGTITLGQPASAITVGLGFTAQLQSVYLEAGNPTIQGQRKKIGAATVRVEASRGLEMGSNQTDGSTLNPIQIAPPWLNMKPVPDQGQPAYLQGVMPLWTGDARIAVSNDLGKPGQIAIQQVNPLPMNVVAIVTEAMEGDTPSQQAPQKQRGGNERAGG